MERLADGGPTPCSVARTNPACSSPKCSSAGASGPGSTGGRRISRSTRRSTRCRPTSPRRRSAPCTMPTRPTAIASNAMWTAAKLHEIQALAVADRKLQALVTARFRDEFIAKAGREGVSSKLTEQFMDQFVATEMPTVAALRDAHRQFVAFRVRPTPRRSLRRERRTAAPAPRPCTARSCAARPRGSRPPPCVAPPSCPR